MLCVVLAALWAVYPSPPQDWIVVERGRVGTVSIGAAAESVYSEFGDRAKLIDLKLEGHLTPALEIKRFGSQLVASMIAEIGRRITGLSFTESPWWTPACEQRKA